ncbi:GATA transcription factor 1-like protein [Tanacetum coccineum]
MASDPNSCLIDDDDLLNFCLEEEDDDKTPSSHPSFPEFAEEELEWLSNKDAFPALDDILSTPNQTILVSLLDNNYNTSSSGNSNSISHSSITSCCGSLRVPLNCPVRKRSTRKRRGKQCWWWNQVMPTPSSFPKPSPAGGVGAATIGRRCQHCLADKTPQWRGGPMGPKTLCNVCGVRYKSVALHSNSHRKIMEMRKKMQAG